MACLLLLYFGNV
ncbi:uncharacterized protein FFNC_15274 [Fusarium fujikuroi]|nr:uncharacterized protein FFNC_15274 [Fusarium fujikuroi]